LSKLAAKEGHVRRGVNAQPYTVSLHFEHGHDDVIADEQLLAGLPADHEHDFSSLKR
jgi:hypothetical protein